MNASKSGDGEVKLNVLVCEINSFGFGNETHEDQGKCLRVEIFYMEWHLK